MSDQDGELARLIRENEKLKRINAALMSRVERAMDQPTSAYSLFEAAITLDKRVRHHTAELHAALRSVERTNEALKRAKLQADQANSFKSSFLASVNHDLLQPLNAARLSLSALIELETDTASSALIRQVDRALTSLEDIIRTLLDISKLDAGVMQPNLSDFEMERVLEPLRAEFVALAGARGLKLVVRRSDATVRSDPLMLRRIVQNLLSNALRYTRRGGVLLGCRRRGDKLRIEIFDTGPGIEGDRREAIFEEFQRGHAMSGEHVGFGLGLSIVRRLAHAMDHPIGLASRVGHGSMFSITVPRAEESAYAVTEDAGPHAFTRYGLDSAHVLMVENEPNVAQAMRSLLERWGCGVVVAASTGEARQAVRGRCSAPDLVIADLHLDNGELGFDAIRAVQSEVEKPIPAFIVTADHSERVTIAAADFGVEVLRKPIKPAELRSLMAHLLA